MTGSVNIDLLELRASARISNVLTLISIHPFKAFLVSKTYILINVKKRGQGLSGHVH